MLSAKQINLLMSAGLISPQKSNNTLNLSNQQFREFPNLPNQHPQSSIFSLQLSYNYLQELPEFPNLQSLNISFNFFKGLNKLKCPNLKYLDASANRLQSINISNNMFPYLQTLSLKNNQIKFLMDIPPSVIILHIDRNRLQGLYINAPKLKILTASYNQIQHIVVKFPQLQYLDLEHNICCNLDELTNMLQEGSNLFDLNLLENPICKNALFITVVLSRCLQIIKLNGITINPYIRQGFKLLREEQKLNLTIQKISKEFQSRSLAQMKIKQEKIQELKLKQQELEKQFKNYLEVEQKQINSLQMVAQSIIGKNKQNIIIQHDQFKKQAIQKSLLNQIGDSKTINKQQSHLKLVKNNQKQYQAFIKLKQKQQQQLLHQQQQQQHQINNNKTESQMTDKLQNRQNQFIKKKINSKELKYRKSNDLVNELTSNILSKQKDSTLQKNKYNQETKKNVNQKQNIVNQKCFPFLHKYYRFIQDE